jgi:hypothetical protein
MRMRCCACHVVFSRAGAPLRRRRSRSGPVGAPAVHQ